MSLHDAYARTTPYELAFPEQGRAGPLAEAVRIEGAARGVDPETLDGFMTLGAVETFVRSLADSEHDPAALRRFGPLAFHGVRFHEADQPVFLVSTHVARYLVEGAPSGQPRPNPSAGYLQLPQHLFWTAAAGDAPESIDGIFWCASRARVLHTLVVTGVRPDRPGLGIVPLPAAPIEDASTWLELDAREEGGDFSTDLPGSDIDGLYGVETPGEVFMLLARFFAYVESAPHATQRFQPPADLDREGPRASALPFTRVSLVA
ncbi:MAG: hypothetical protein OEN56_04000 [Gemmatimonadota bacterium]|nr:hypothetical protein [Gemmatimonadota bacterium]